MCVLGGEAMGKETEEEGGVEKWRREGRRGSEESS